MMTEEQQKLIDQRLAEIRSKIVCHSPRSDKPKIDINQEAKIYKSCFYKVEPNFNIDKAYKKLLNSLFAWVWRLDKYNELGVDYNKGFLLYGSIGTGKTMTMRAFQKYMLHVRDWLKVKDYRLCSIMTSATSIANEYVIDGQPAILKYVERDRNLFIDEFGREPIPAKYYGTPLNVLQFLLQIRYDHRSESVTHITTNVELADIMPMYGDYVADRFKEMFNFVRFSGDSLRR